LERGLVAGTGHMTGAGRAPRSHDAVIPRATYRLQFNAGFRFADATRLVPYLASLGISHVYCSPYLRARPGSVHGYDIVDHNSLNPEIGTAADFDGFCAALRSHGMGQLLDFVPNHVGIMGADNLWWMHVLENGRASSYAKYFDIDWSPPNPTLANKLLVPVLGDPYGAVLERGDLRLGYMKAANSLAVSYFEHRFPLDPRSYPLVLERVIDGLHADEAGLRELRSLVASFRHLPDRDACVPEQAAARERDKEAHKARLAALLGRHPRIRAVMDAAIEALNGTPGDASSFDRLHALLECQCYRLAYWRVAADDINYRRFFDINDLAALRMEVSEVFESTHRFVLELIRDGKLDGLRIDHPDGLYDPAGYFARVQAHASPPGSDARSARATQPRLPLYLLVEKITASFERLPLQWWVHGTTGYNFARVVNGLSVDARGKARLDRVYRSFIGEYLDWAETARESKLLVLRSLLAAELNVLANQLTRIAEANRHTRDFTLASLRRVLMEIIADFPVYRTYVADSASIDDRRYIDWAIARARKSSPTTNAPLLQFARSMILADVSGLDESMHAQVRAFARKFQQVTAPVVAKGVEDTAHYRFTRLASLNEVGSEPELFGTSARQFHADAGYRSRHWPHEMLATSTHDTKRAEDVRTRLNVLSELPGTWRRNLLRWSRMNRARRKLVDDQWAPGPHAEYLLYQTLLGTWPLEAMDDAAHAEYCERMESYMVKAMREAKRRTSWANVNEDYESALRQFVRVALEKREGNLFLLELDAFARLMARFGFLNGLAQTLCKLTAPGVPDIYQGNEMWDWSLVDPDNRRAVDYELRRGFLAEVRAWHAGGPEMLRDRLGNALASPADGRCKLYLTWSALQCRKAHEALFRDGGYVPLRVVGTRALHVLAYARRLGDEVAVIAVPRLCRRLLGEGNSLPLGADVWADTRIELPRKRMPSEFASVLDGRTVNVRDHGLRQILLVAELLAAWPCSLLIAA
jgi:(1->4)-alpha-D-glucan 1-alpha-D-glucosylmutase